MSPAPGLTQCMHTRTPHCTRALFSLWRLHCVWYRFEQAYPTLRLMLQCGHLSFVFGPYGQLCHFVAQGSGDEPRCCVLLHVHGEMTDQVVTTPPLRFDLTGFTGCSGEQPFDFDGKTCDAGMGFEQTKSAKSVARNKMEMALRRLPRVGQTDPPHLTPLQLRELFVELCVSRGSDEAAPLLGDVVILTSVTADYRGHGVSEREVRSLLEGDLKSSLRCSFANMSKRECEARVRACLEFVRYLSDV